jgi:hypothetical protein
VAGREQLRCGCCISLLHSLPRVSAALSVCPPGFWHCGFRRIAAMLEQR